MDAAFVITWTVPFAGREAKALEFAADAAAYWGKQAAEGKCTAPEMFFFPGHAMWMVKGERTVLEGLVAGDTVRGFMARGSVLLEDWTWVVADAGSGADRYLTDYAAAAAAV